jgi:hypothetical protein
VDEQLEFLRLIASRLDSSGIPYMFTGSIALAVYAAPRMTRDVDVVVECSKEDAGNLVEAFASDSYIDRGAVLDAIASRGMFNIIHHEWVVKADLIVRKEDEYHQLEFQRRRRIDLGDFEAWVVSPEDLMLSKLLWRRDSGSETQMRDVQALARSVSDLDWPYLALWADRLGVSEALAEARLQ